MYSKKYVLIVDDDREIRDLLSLFLSQNGYFTTLAKDGKEMFKYLNDKKFDLIILDVMLPGDDGLTLCQKIRAFSSIPVIMLTAKGEDTERIIGLELGADDYIAKPFNPRELLARIKAVIRRVEPNGKINDIVARKMEIFRFCGWALNKANRQLFSADHMEITLSSGEFDLLVAFLERPQRILSRDQLLDITKNRFAGPYDRSIDIQISRLRHKLEEDPKNPVLLKTVRGGGYILATPVEREVAV